MHWTYEGSDLLDTPIQEGGDSYYGFVYCITYKEHSEAKTPFKYIGKKVFLNKSTLPALKKGKLRPEALRIARNIKGKRTYFDIVHKESNWKTYVGSSKLTSDLTIVSKEILALAVSKRNLTYLECKALFYYHVLETEEYMNDNILGKFFSNVTE